MALVETAPAAAPPPRTQRQPLTRVEHAAPPNAPTSTLSHRDAAAQVDELD
jgi:hypothetical protein